MNINEIFNLFDSGSREKIQEEEIQVTDLSDHPIYWLGMFKKLIQNHKVFKKKIVSFLEKAQPELDLEDINSTGDDLAFERAWFYVSKFDPSLEEHNEVINLILDTYLVNALEESIFHFQEKEEYEKCSEVKQLIDKLS